MGQDESSLSSAGPPETLSDRTLPAVAEYIKSGAAKRVVVLTGAGISTSAGIPDFRSPKTGLYNNLARLNLPYAEAVFDIAYFRRRPEPFYVLAKELYPGKFHPTVSHAFIALLAKKGLLQMLFTQNIDCLERAAGVPSDKIIEAHGSFATQRCIECKTEFPDDAMKQHVFQGVVPECKEKGCNGLVKPDIVFFGEALPKVFDNNSYQVAMADLVLVLGTSLTVYPFAGLPEMASPGKPRLLFNMERVGRLGHRADDVIELGSCDAGVRKLADELGWGDELEQLWRGVVGDKEAERQLATQLEVPEALEDDVDRLADEVDAVVIGDDGTYNDADVDKGYVSAMVDLLDPAKNPRLRPKASEQEQDANNDDRGPEAEPKEQPSGGTESQAESAKTEKQTETQTEITDDDKKHDGSGATSRVPAPAPAPPPPVPKAAVPLTKAAAEPTTLSSEAESSQVTQVGAKETESSSSPSSSSEAKASTDEKTGSS